MKNKTLEQLGKNIQTLRKEKGLSQEEFAERIGIATNTISSIERGYAFMTIQTLDRICAILDIEPKELFANNEHIFEEEEKDMYGYILNKLEFIKKDTKKLNILYKLVKALL